MWTKAGYAGEDLPKAVFQTVLGKVESKTSFSADGDAEMVDGASTSDGGELTKNEAKKTTYITGDISVNAWRQGMDIVHPLKESLVYDWDAFERLWQHAFESLYVNPPEQPLLLAEPDWVTKEQREKIVEIAFENFQIPAIFLAKSSVLTA